MESFRPPPPSTPPPAKPLRPVAPVCLHVTETKPEVITPVLSGTNDVSDVYVAGKKTLVGYLKSRLRIVRDTLQADLEQEHDPPIEETHDLLLPANNEEVLPIEAYKAGVWKIKPEGSKLVTRDDGLMYQQVDHHVTRTALYTPKDSQNMMPVHSYSGIRITEGVYNSGEKFVDNTPWSPEGV